MFAGWVLRTREELTVTTHLLDHRRTALLADFISQLVWLFFFSQFLSVLAIRIVAACDERSEPAALDG